MIGQHGHFVQEATITTDNLLSTAIFVGGANHVSFEIPTFSVGLNATTSNVFVQVAATSDGTFRRAKDAGIYSASSGIQDWEVPSDAGNYNAVCRPAARFDFIKIELSNTATANVLCNVHVHQ